MKTTKFQNFDCVCLENSSLTLLVTQSVGPRVISLSLKGGENLFAVLPDFVARRPDGIDFHFYGGHRLWHAPENMPRTYVLDDQPVEIIERPNGLSVIRQVEVGTGIVKSLDISLVGDKAQVIVQHTLTNCGLWPVECAPWAITQFRTGGAAILPQSQEQTEVLPNRAMALWPYTDLGSPCVSWGNRFIIIRAEMPGPFKVGFPNPRGWLAYWLEDTLFVKRAGFDAKATYYDFGSSSECYSNDKFLELETLAPIGTLAPGESAQHTETWELYGGVECPTDEVSVEEIVKSLGLE